MDTQTASAVAAALVALAFSMSTFERWLARRRRHELAWSVSLLMFALASAALATGASNGWGPALFRLFYLFGAIANVPFLALGTVYLLAGRRQGDRAAIAVSLATAFAAGVVAVAPLRAAVPRHTLARGSEVFGALPRVLAATASGAGALVVVGGAVWSVVRARRPVAGSNQDGGRPARGRVVLSNTLIAAGTLVTGASGLLNSVLDEMTGFAVTLVVGIVVIFAGFLVATTGGPRPVSPGEQAEPAAPASRPSRTAATARS